MEPEDSLPQSQVPSTCPYPEPARSSPHIPTSNFLVSAVNGTCHIQAPNFPRTKSHVLFRCLDYVIASVQAPDLLFDCFATWYTFLLWGFVSTSPKPQAGGPPLIDCWRLLFNIFASYHPYWRLFLHPQPEDAPCRGGRDHLIRLHTLRFAISVIYRLRL